jgi:hypothetical protein
MNPSGQQFSAREIAKAAKRALHEGKTILGVSVRSLGDRLGMESDSLIEQWCSEHASAHVPMWILAHPGLPRELRAWLFARLDESYVRGTSGLTIPSADDQSNVVTGVMGRLLVAMSAAMIDKRHSPEEAREELPIVVALRKHLETYEAALRETANSERTSNVVEISAKGSSR